MQIGREDPTFFGSQSAQKFSPGHSHPLLHSGAHVFSPRAKPPRSWPSNSQVPVKWTSPLYFATTSPATSPLIEDGITKINQMNRPEERNCARPRPRLGREHPPLGRPWRHGGRVAPPPPTGTPGPRFAPFPTRTGKFVSQEGCQFD